VNPKLLMFCLFIVGMALGIIIGFAAGIDAALKKADRERGNQKE
jgi:hypothetical protein